MEAPPALPLGNDALSIPSEGRGIICDDRIAGKQPDRGESLFADLGLVPLLSGRDHVVTHRPNLL